MKLGYEKELEKVKKIVEESPRGITIKKIAKKIGVNRNVVAKYLDVLQMAGQIEMEKFGRSNVYFPAQSVPVSAMFDYANEFFVIVRKDLTTVEINNPFIKYLGLINKDKIVGKKIKTLHFTKGYPKMTDNIVEALRSQEILEDHITYKRKKNGKPDHFRVKFIPTALTDGEQGVIIIISKELPK
jgi:hypothetical protein